uniref:Uncharacterized protein n=1 Tax=Tetradesmus obliquus TaxID=3088 RepID=A0A383V3V2_TETOB|eukprot:jgi/Sobl393_1/5390/SZX59600.1
MLDSPEPVSTACGAAALHQLVAEGAIPMDSCLERLLQTIRQATSLSSTSSSSRAPQSEPHVLATLRHALAALASRSMKEHITPVTLPVLLQVLQLPRVIHTPQASREDRLWQGSKDSALRDAQDRALSILDGFAHDTAGKLAFAAAGGIKVLVAGAEGATWFRCSDSDGLSSLCDLTKDPAVSKAVVEAGAVEVLLNELSPDDVDDVDACLAAHALARLAAAPHGSRAIAAVRGGIKCILKTLSATYNEYSEEAGFMFQGLSLCLFHLAHDASSSRALDAAGGLPPFIRCMLDAGLNEQQAKAELRDRCIAEAMSRQSFIAFWGFDPRASLHDSDKYSDQHCGVALVWGS